VVSIILWKVPFAEMVESFSEEEFVPTGNLQVPVVIPPSQEQASSPRPISLTINEQETQLPLPIYIRDTMAYLPLFALAEHLNGVIVEPLESGEVIRVINSDFSIYSTKVYSNVLTQGETEIQLANSSFWDYEDCYVSSDFLKIVLDAEIHIEGRAVEISQVTESSESVALPGLREAIKFRHYQPELLERYIAYKEGHPELDYFTVVTHVNIGLDFEFYQNVQIIENPSDTLVLCNKYNKLPDGYVPEGYEVKDSTVLRLIPEAQAQFDLMAKAATASGVKIYIHSGYRSEKIQSYLYNKYTSRNAATVDRMSARPGYSEHQTGLATDINVASASLHFERTKEFAFLASNAHAYGFILRYPLEKEWITGYGYEPWHYRYVGVEVATAIHNLDITFDEYYAIYLVPQNPNQ
jgi:hypothetical protein